MKPHATILDVARACGVAKSTVSRVLNGGYASAGVRERVLKAAQDLGFAPSATARNLSTGRSGCLGLALDHLRQEWLPGLLQGMVEETAPRHLSLMIAVLYRKGSHDPLTVGGWIAQRRVDGLILLRPGAKERELVKAAQEAGLPLALISPDESFDGGWALRGHNFDAGAQVGHHLLRLGHRRFGFVGGPQASLDTQERLAGLRQALAAEGARLERGYPAYADYQVEGGEQAARRWLAQDPARRPTAMVLANDSMALGFLHAAQQAGIKVPRQVSVAGFDDVAASRLVLPGLTTARQPLNDMGAEAVRCLLKSMDGRERPRAVSFAMDLVVRESTGPAPKN